MTTKAGFETYADLAIDPTPMRPHILAGASIVFGDDYYNGLRETVNLSGKVEINKWPMPGFHHSVRDDGTAEFGVELISRQDVGIKGFSYILDDKIQVLSHPDFPNTGSISQIVPGRNFPAKFTIRRHGVLVSSGLRLVHRNVIEIEGIVDRIPPYKHPLTAPLFGAANFNGGQGVMKQVNAVGGVNLPEAWSPADAQLRPLPPVVAFFASEPVPCISTLTMPRYVIQVSATVSLQLVVGGEHETIALSGDHGLAAGLELLVVEAPQHQRDDSVQIQLARAALVGESRLLGGRIMLRNNFFRVSCGPLGRGTERLYDALDFPAPLALEVFPDLATPGGELAGMSSLHLTGTLTHGVSTGTTLAGRFKQPVHLIATDGRKIASIIALTVQLGGGIFGPESIVDQAVSVAAEAF